MNILLAEEILCTNVECQQMFQPPFDARLDGEEMPWHINPVSFSVNAYLLPDKLMFWRYYATSPKKFYISSCKTVVLYMSCKQSSVCCRSTSNSFFLLSHIFTFFRCWFTTLHFTANRTVLVFYSILFHLYLIFFIFFCPPELSACAHLNKKGRLWI